MITKIKAHNFFSWEDLEFDVQAGVTLIDGFNHDEDTSEGSGKSSIFNAIAWGIYGKIPKDLNIDDVIRHNQKNCSVSLEFSSGLKITRTRKPNDLFYVENGEEKRGKDATETQKQIIELVGRSFEGFLQTGYHAQNNQSRFIKANQEDKAKILSEIIELEVFDRARKFAHEKVKSLEIEQREVGHQRELKGKDRALIESSILMEEAKFLQAEKDHLQKGETLKVQIQNLSAQIKTQDLIFIQQKDEHDKELVELQTGVEDMLAEVKGSSDILSQATLVGNLKENLPNPQQHEAEVEELARLKAEVAQHSQLSIFRGQQRDLAKQFAQQHRGLGKEVEELTNFVKNPSKDCPTCGTTLENCSTVHALESLSKLKAQRVGLEGKVSEISKALAQPLSEVGEIKEKIEVLKKSSSEYQKVRSQLAQEEAKLATFQDREKGTLIRIEVAEKTIQNKMKNPPQKSLENILKLEEEAVRAKNALTEHTSIPRPAESSEVVALKIKLGENQKEAKELQGAQRAKVTKGLAYQQLKESFRTIKSYIFEGVLAELNFRISEYLQDLFEVECSMTFQNEGGKVVCSISLAGEEVKLGNLSGGQFRRASLAVDLALQDISESRKKSELGVLVLDEYFYNLSEESMEKCLELLVKRQPPVLLVEHNKAFQTIIDNTFLVSKRNGVSVEVVDGT